MIRTWIMPVIVLMFALTVKATEDYDNPYVIVPTCNPQAECVPDVPDPNINFTVLDSIITKGLQRPCESNGTDIIKAAQRYFREMQELVVTMEHSRNAGQQLQQILDFKERPNFINLRINKELLKIKYRWKRKTFEKLSQYINGTRWALIDLKKALDANSTEYSDFESSPESETVSNYF
uniref:Uncharacterized protein n=1 Tax=Clastoptera arizonana TaxID=38151 RepID=A0A1B6E540_9HEMI